MNFSIIPITYLLCLSILLTPIAILIIYQILRFNYSHLSIKKHNQYLKNNILTFKENYNIANKYIYIQQLHLALMIIENDINTQDLLNDEWSAKYYNAAGFILQKLNYYQLAKKYYLKASHLDPFHKSSQKNLQYLLNKR